MNIKKILASTAASVLAVSAMSVAASAAAVDVTVKGQADMSLADDKIGKPETGDSFAWVAKDENFAADVDLSKVKKIEADVTVDSGFANGCIGGNVDGAWASTNWEVSSADKTTISWELAGTLEEFQIQVWWMNTLMDGETHSGPGTLTISDVRLLDADGKDLTASGDNTENPPAESTPAESTPAESTPAESTPAESAPAESTPAESAPAADTNKPNTDTGIEGVAAILGVAVVAGGAMIVAKKRK